MSSFVAPERAYSDEQLAFLQSVDSPTIANAIEPFQLRDRTDGYIGGNIGCLYPTSASWLVRRSLSKHPIRPVRRQP